MAKQGTAQFGSNVVVGEDTNGNPFLEEKANGNRVILNPDGTVNALAINIDKHVLSDSATAPSVGGELRNNAGDLEAFSGNNVRNLSHIGYGIEKNLLPEGSQRGLAADALGEPYNGQMTTQTDAILAEGKLPVYFEAATKSSAGDEDVTVHLYDVTAAADVTSITITGGSSRAASADLAGSFTSGNELRVDWEVTTASATSGATFDAIGAKLTLGN